MTPGHRTPLGLGAHPGFNDKMDELYREALLTDGRHRTRDVRQSPDGLLHVLVDDADGAILRIDPAR